MGKKILVLDDKRKVRRDMKAHIKREDRSSDLRICGDCCSVIYELDLLKSKGEQPFDLFILDLNINTIGLTDGEAKKTENGLRTGWVLFIDEILKRDPANRAKVVFFSGWLKRLEDYIESVAANKDEKELYYELKKNGRLIEKAEGYASLDQFIAS